MRPDRPWIVPLLFGALLVTAASGDFDAAEHRPEPGLIGGWSTAGCEFHRQPRTTTVAGITTPELDAAMARIDRGGRDRYPNSYAGLEVDQQRVRAIVYRVPSADFDDFIRDSAEDTCVVVRDAPHGLAELTAWHDRIVQDLRCGRTAAYASRRSALATTAPAWRSEPRTSSALVRNFPWSTASTPHSC